MRKNVCFLNKKCGKWCNYCVFLCKSGQILRFMSREWNIVTRGVRGVQWVRKSQKIPPLAVLLQNINYCEKLMFLLCILTAFFVVWFRCCCGVRLVFLSVSGCSKTVYIHYIQLPQFCDVVVNFVYCPIFLLNCWLVNINPRLRCFAVSRLFRVCSLLSVLAVCGGVFMPFAVCFLLRLGTHFFAIFTPFYPYM